MQSLGNSKSSAGRGLNLKMGTIGMSIMLVVFLVAVVFAANQNDVVGWFVAIVSLAWLLLFAFVVFSLRSATKKAASRLAGMPGFAPAQAPAGSRTGTTMVDEATAFRDEKLDHSFKIVQVQVKVVRDYLGKDQAMVDRALETIEITAHNGRGMIRNNDDGGPVEGTVVG